MPAAGIPKPRKMSTDQVLNVISHPVRWRILEAFDGDLMTSKEIGEKLGIAPALVQYHLKELYKVGLVSEHDLPGSKRLFTYRRRTLKATVDISGSAMIASVTR